MGRAGFRNRRDDGSDKDGFQPGSSGETQSRHHGTTTYADPNTTTYAVPNTTTYADPNTTTYADPNTTYANPNTTTYADPTGGIPAAKGKVPRLEITMDRELWGASDIARGRDS